MLSSPQRFRATGPNGDQAETRDMTAPSSMPVAPFGTGYMPQLNGLRALAVAAVMYHHFFGWAFGAVAGVRLFFVLSGFLITGILLRARVELAIPGQNLRSVLGRFYARRMLRIFPLYYAVVLLAVALGWGPARELVWWLLSYSLNLKMASQGWYEASFAHFWSLAVEEQFYLFWPWLIVVIPRRLLWPTIIGATAAAPLFRLSYVLADYTNMTPLATYISTVTCLDSLGAGAILSLLLWERAPEGTGADRGARVVAIGSLGLFMLATPFGGVNTVLQDTALSGLFACLIYGAVRGYPNRFGRLLQSTPAQYIGKISYGLYVYHPFVREAIQAMYVDADGRRPAERLSSAALGIVCSVILAGASWQLFEKPINDRKRHFHAPVQAT